MNGELFFEQGPIRPPSEAQSLLIRTTRNCPWNRCAFCHTYRGEVFSHRPMAELLQEIETIRILADRVKELSWEWKEGGLVTESVVQRIHQGADGMDALRSVALWLYFGGESVFLQDANSLMMKTADLLEVLAAIRRVFPTVRRVTSYARSRTAARKSLEELQALRAAGLSRIHMGLESGCDPLLVLIRKGLTAADHREGGRKVVAAGMSLCTYVMPGLGGRAMSRPHALETAAVLNEIGPQYIRLRSLHLVPGTDLHRWAQEGSFAPQTDDETIAEIRFFVEHLQGLQTTVVSDHILNLLEEVEGRIPEEKDHLLTVLDRYLALAPEERLVFRVGRRIGRLRRLDDLKNPLLRAPVHALIGRLNATDSSAGVEDLLRRCRDQQI